MTFQQSGDYTDWRPSLWTRLLCWFGFHTSFGRCHRINRHGAEREEEKR